MSHEFQLPLGGIQFGTMGQADAESPIVNYNRSKLANILYTKSLARRLLADGHDHVFVNVVHPGYCFTGIDSNSDKTFGKVLSTVAVRMRSWVGRPACKGAISQIYCAVAEEIEEKKLTGRYFVPDAHELRPSKAQ